MGKSFIQLNHKNPNTIELLKHPNEWTLLTLVATRARRIDNKIEGLSVRQAMIGDHKSCGLTRQQYRTVLINLEKWHFLTTKATNKGTIATLCNDDIFDINVDGSQPSNQPKPNHQATSNNKVKKEKKNNNNNFCRQVINMTNDILGKNYKHIESNYKPIRARMNETSYTLEDFQRVILTKKRDVYFIANPKYYNPSTLFGTKFEKYLNETRAKAFDEA